MLLQFNLCPFNPIHASIEIEFGRILMKYLFLFVTASWLYLTPVWALAADVESVNVKLKRGGSQPIQLMDQLKFHFLVLRINTTQLCVQVQIKLFDWKDQTKTSLVVPIEAKAAI